jgi:hypothetical protein
MSGDGGNPPSLRDLLGAYEKSGLVIIGVLNTAILFTSPQEGWKESDRYQSYIELAGFLNQAHHYSHSPFDMNWPSRLEFIHLQRAASYEIWKATKHEVTRKLLDDRP